MTKRAPEISGTHTLNKECFMRLAEGLGGLGKDQICEMRSVRKMCWTRPIILLCYWLQCSTNARGTRFGSDQRNHQTVGPNLSLYGDLCRQPDERRYRHAGVSLLPYPTSLPCL